MEILSQILLIQQVTLSGIIVLITILISQGIFQRGGNLNLTNRYEKFKEEWKNKNQNKKINEEDLQKKFVKFTEFLYNQAFWTVAFQAGFSLFILGMILTFREILIKMVGWIPYLTILTCHFYVIYRFYRVQVKKSQELAISNLKGLLINPNIYN